MMIMAVKVMYKYFRVSGCSWNPYLLSSLGTFTKLQRVTISLVMCLSVCLHGTTQLLLARLSWNFIWIFLKTCWENSSFIKIWLL